MLPNGGFSVWDRCCPGSSLSETFVLRCRLQKLWHHLRLPMQLGRFVGHSKQLGICLGLSRKPGVYSTWGDCFAQVANYQDCLYRPYKSKSDADRVWALGFNKSEMLETSMMISQSGSKRPALTLAFRYQKNQYNVFEVNQTGYDNCTTEGALGNWSSGKDFIPLNKPQRYYFICGNGQCFNGMKVSILVHPLPSPPTSPETASNHSSQKSSSAPLLFFNWGLSTLLFSSAVAHFGLVGCI